MSKQTMFKIVYLVPEYLMLYLVLAKFFHGVELAVYCGTIFYMYFILGYLYLRKISQVLTVVLMALPIIIGMFIPANDPIRFVVQLVIMILSVIRMLFFYTSKTFFTYNRNKYVIDSLIFIAIALIIGASVLVYYILILRLLLLMMMNSTTDMYGKAEKSDIVFMLLNCIFVLLLPIAEKTGDYLTMFFHKHDIVYYIFYVIGYVTYLVYYIASFLFKHPQKQVPPEMQPFDIKGMMKTLQDKSAALQGRQNLTVEYISFGMLLLIGIIVLIIVYKKFKQLGSIKEESDEYKQDEIDIPKVKRKVPLKDLPLYRAMYVKILMLSVKKGFEFKNSTTARQFKEFLKRNVNVIDAVERINGMYERIRYAGQSVNENEFKDNFTQIYDDLKK